MKKLLNKRILFSACLFVLSNIISFSLYAQDSSGSTSSTTTTTRTSTTQSFTIQPWMWIAGGVILLVIIIGLLSGRNKNNVTTDKVTYTKTVERK